MIARQRLSDIHKRPRRISFRSLGAPALEIEHGNKEFSGSSQRIGVFPDPAARRAPLRPAPASQLVAFPFPGGAHRSFLVVGIPDQAYCDCGLGGLQNLIAAGHLALLSNGDEPRKVDF